MTTHRLGYLFLLDVDPPLRLWTGFRPLTTAPGVRWVGAGHVIELPAIKMLINGRADRYDFIVSGVAPESLRLVLEDRAEVPGAEAQILRVDFDEYQQIVGIPVIEWRGTADVLTTGSDPSDMGRSRTITLSVRSGDTRRSNPDVSLITDADQRRRSPTDAIASHVGAIQQGMTRRFGPR